MISSTQARPLAWRTATVERLAVIAIACTACDRIVVFRDDLPRSGDGRYLCDQCGQEAESAAADDA